ncbi:MAG: 50S ribosomal protein L11 methyltransferase [Oscillospiraceae bacterium]|nr:50S ribosomal protein L11 methyltransferase [Oscillospiraceae bacterium]
MNWNEVKIFTEQDGIEELTEKLTALGVNGFLINDPGDFEALMNHALGSWDYVDDGVEELRGSAPYVAFYLPCNEQGAALLEAIRSEIDKELFISSIKEEDWADNWKQYFKPFEVGERLTVKPSWEEYSGGGGRVILEIDPASSFGTGQHETTKLCLELLEKHVKSDVKMLDIGCGSGILFIAGLLLGAGYAAAVDIDEHSAETAKENAAKNKIPAEKYSAYCGNILNDEKMRRKIGGGYGLITANIVSDVIIALAPIFGGLMKEDGMIILSGIITERESDVFEAMAEHGFLLAERREEGGWVALAFTKK